MNILIKKLESLVEGKLIQIKEILGKGYFNDNLISMMLVYKSLNMLKKTKTNLVKREYATNMEVKNNQEKKNIVEEFNDFTEKQLNHPGFCAIDKKNKIAHITNYTHAKYVKGKKTVCVGKNEDGSDCNIVMPFVKVDLTDERKMEILQSGFEDVKKSSLSVESKNGENICKATVCILNNVKKLNLDVKANLLKEELNKVKNRSIKD